MAVPQPPLHVRGKDDVGQRCDGFGGMAAALRTDSQQHADFGRTGIARVRQPGHQPECVAVFARHQDPVARPRWIDRLLPEQRAERARCGSARQRRADMAHRSEEHTSELQSLMRISYAVFCLKKKNTKTYLHYDNKIAAITNASQVLPLISTH